MYKTELKWDNGMKRTKTFRSEMDAVSWAMRKMAWCAKKSFPAPEIKINFVAC